MITIVTLVDIHNAIIDNITLALVDTEFKIDTEFIPTGKNKPNGVIFSSTSIVENIIRPSFYIDFENGLTNKFNYKLKERNITVKLFYFAKNRDNSKIELLKIQDFLENIFLEELVVNEDFHFPVSEIEVDVMKKEGYLTVNFDLHSLEEIEIIDNSEFAEELIYNQKNN